jgi:hypothetical protein
MYIQTDIPQTHTRLGPESQPTAAAKKQSAAEIGGQSTPLLKTLVQLQAEYKTYLLTVNNKYGSKSK